MALTIVQAHALANITPAAVDWDLGSPPANTKGLVMWTTQDLSVTPVYGGEALEVVTQYDPAGSELMRLWQLINDDFAAASGTHLTFTSPGYVDGQAVHAAWLVAGAPVVLVDASYSVGAGVTISLDPGSGAACVAYACGYIGKSGGVTVSNIAPQSGQTQLSEVDGIGGGVSPGAACASYKSGISAPTTVGFDFTSGGGTSGAQAAALYSEGATGVILSAYGEVTAFRAGLTIAPGADSMVWLFRASEVTRFRPLRVQTSGPRQVALVGTSLGTSEMTEGGTEGYQLTYHAASKPDWQPSGSPVLDTAAWLPLTAVVGGVPELVWDDDDSLIPTLTPLD